jgi:DNA-binding CsgD family transcriptional regulator
LLPEKDDTIPQLSSRETELIHLIAEDLTNKEIADKLFLSVHTIKTHRKNIIKKLGFSFKNTTKLAQLINKQLLFRLTIVLFIAFRCFRKSIETSKAPDGQGPLLNQL